MCCPKSPPPSRLAGRKRQSNSLKACPRLKVWYHVSQPAHQPHDAYAKKLLDSGALGEIKRVTLTITDWYRSPSTITTRAAGRAYWYGEGGGLLY